MRYSARHKQETRERIVISARRLFNRNGFNGVTIEQIMKHAGLTRGGFYRHFKAKEQLYAHAVRQFLCMDPPEPWRREQGNPRAGRTLARAIVEAYLSHEHYEDREGSCPLVALPSDVARSNRTVKRAFREVLDKMVEVFANNLGAPESRPRALALVATCVGGMVIARAVDDPAVGDEFRSAAQTHVLESAGWR